MDCFNGKKLMILGANAATVPLVKTANQMGVTTVVVSNRADDPAKAFAATAYDAECADVPGLISLANREKVDGVLVGVADRLVPAYCRVCEALDLPCYATQNIVDVFSYKDIFKAMCERYGIHGIPEYYLDESLNESDIERIEFPVMVKPVDSYNGIGMSVVTRKEDLGEAVRKALEASTVKRFIVERFMQCDDMGIYYTFIDGKCSASCVYDRYTSDEQPGVSRVCLGGTYPSRHIVEYFERMHRNAVRMFREIGIRNGVLMLSAFYENGEFYVYDTGFRLQGEAPHFFINHLYGFDQREMLIRFALTGASGGSNALAKDEAFFNGKKAATLWFLLKEGTIAKIEGLNNVCKDPRVIEITQRFTEGMSVTKDMVGTEKQVLARLYFVCETKEGLAAALKEYSEKVQVFDSCGSPMLLKSFDFEKTLGA